MIYRSSHISTPYQSLINQRLQSLSRTQSWERRISSVRTGNERLQTHRHSPPSAYQSLPQKQPFTLPKPRIFTFLESTPRPPLARNQAQPRSMLQKPALHPMRTFTYTRYELGSKSLLAHLYPSQTLIATPPPVLQKPSLSSIGTQQNTMQLSLPTQRGDIQQESIPSVTDPCASFAKTSMGKVFSRYEPAAFAILPTATSVKTPQSPASTTITSSVKKMLSLYDLVTPAQPQTPQSPAVLPSTAEKVEVVGPSARLENSVIAKEDNIKQESTKHIGPTASKLNYATEYKLALKSVRSGITVPHLKTLQLPAALPAKAEKVEIIDTPKIDSLPSAKLKNDAIAKEDKTKQKNTKHIGSTANNLSYSTEYKLALKSVRSGITISRPKTSQSHATSLPKAEKVEVASTSKINSSPSTKLEKSAIAKEGSVKHKSTNHIGSAPSKVSYTSKYKLALKSGRAGITTPRHKTTQSTVSLPSRAEKVEVITNSKTDSPPSAKLENSTVAKEGSIKNKSTKHIDSAASNLNYTSKYKLALKSGRAKITTPRLKTPQPTVTLPSIAEKVEVVDTPKINNPPPAKLDNGAAAKEDSIKQESTEQINSATSNPNRASEYKLALKSGRVVITMPRLKALQSHTTLPSIAEKVEIVSTSTIDSHLPVSLENSVTVKEDNIKQESDEQIDSSASNPNRASEYKLALKSGRVVITMPRLRRSQSFADLLSAAEKVEVPKNDSHPSARLESSAIANEDGIEQESIEQIDSAESNPHCASEYTLELKSGRTGIAIPNYEKETKIRFNEEVKLKIIHPSEHKPAEYNLNKKPIQGKKSARGILVTQRTAREIQKEKSIESRLQANIQVKFNREESEFRRERVLELMGLK